MSSIWWSAKDLDRDEPYPLPQVFLLLSLSSCFQLRFSLQILSSDTSNHSESHLCHLSCETSKMQAGEAINRLSLRSLNFQNYKSFLGVDLVFVIDLFCFHILFLLFHFVLTKRTEIFLSHT